MSDTNSTVAPKEEIYNVEENSFQETKLANDTTSVIEEESAATFRAEEFKEGSTEKDGCSNDWRILTTSIANLPPNDSAIALQVFGLIIQYCDQSEESLELSQCLEIARKIFALCLNSTELKDELYLQLMKLTKECVGSEFKLCLWELWLLTTASFPPSKDRIMALSEFVQSVVSNEDTDGDVQAIARRVWNTLKHSVKREARKNPLSLEDLELLLSDSKQEINVKFLDNSIGLLKFDVITTGEEAVELLAKQINLENYSGFGLYDVRSKPSTEESEQKDQDTTTLIEDSEYVLDFVAEARQQGRKASFLFKLKIIREQDEHITEPTFINLCYLQIQNEFLKGNYPVVRDDAAQLCALQIAAARGAGLEKPGEEFSTEVENYLEKRIRMTRSREEWRKDVYTRYQNLSSFNSDYAKLQFLRIFRSLPYGNSIFFSVKRIEDPIGLLPSKIIFGINRRGVHFFRPVPKEYLHSAELRDIMQFGSNKEGFFLKMKVAGVLHVFQFATPKGEDICMILQTHISDSMMKRYARIKNRRQEGPSQVFNNTTFGAKYEKHLNKMQKMANELQDTIEDLEKSEKNSTYELEKKQDELAEIRRQNAANKEKKEKLEEIRNANELFINRAEWDYVTLYSDVADAERATASSADDRKKQETEQIENLKESIEKVLSELEETEQREEERKLEIIENDAEIDKLLDEEKELEIQMQTKVQIAKSDLERTIQQSKDAIKEKADAVNDAQEKLANLTAMCNADMEEFKRKFKDQAKLNELRFKLEDFHMLEAEWAAEIAKNNTAIKGLDEKCTKELDTKKNCFNEIEDLKGKIRVQCRVRPFLETEEDKDQEMGVKITDEKTIGFQHRLFVDEYIEHKFTKVFPPEVDQETVFESTRHLVQSAVDGYNVCIFVYGQTGAGKTYTVIGPEENAGIAPRSVHELFRIVEKEAGHLIFTIKCYMIEIYRDQMIDVLLPEGKRPVKLEINKRDGITHIKGATSREAQSVDQLYEIVGEGLKRRHVSSTEMNKESSRSHLIVSFVIQSTDLQTQEDVYGKLTFVDLAGAEKLDKESFTEEQQEESISNRRSLDALNKVIHAAASTEFVEIPYEENILTNLMKDSIGGTAKTLMFVNVLPHTANLGETRLALRYATTAKCIRNDGSKVIFCKEKAKLEEQLREWKKRTDITDVLQEFL